MPIENKPTALNLNPLKKNIQDIISKMDYYDCRWSTHIFSSEDGPYNPPVNPIYEQYKEPEAEDPFVKERSFFEHFFDYQQQYEEQYEEECIFQQPDEPHDTFGLKRSKSQEELRENYKKAALQHHPDKGGDHDAFIKLKNEYDRLKKKFWR